jgi:hypothetical protein
MAQLALVSVATPISPTTAAGPEQADSTAAAASSATRFKRCRAIRMASASGRVGCCVWMRT